LSRPEDFRDAFFVARVPLDAPGNREGSIPVVEFWQQVRGLRTPVYVDEQQPMVFVFPGRQYPSQRQTSTGSGR